MNFFLLHFTKSACNLLHVVVTVRLGYGYKHFINEIETNKRACSKNIKNTIYKLMSKSILTNVPKTTMIQIFRVPTHPGKP